MLGLFGAVAALVALLSPAQGPANDEAALIALDQAYAAAWERNDADGVMALFAQDAVIIPHDGDPPRVGADAIRQFWFPTPPSGVVIENYDHEVTAVTVSGDQGVVWGRFDLAFVYQGRTSRYTGNFLLVARREAEAGWKITHLTWNDPPPTIS